VWQVVIEPRIGGDGVVNATAQNDDLQIIAVAAEAVAGQIVIDVGPAPANDWILDTTSPAADDVVEDRTFFLDADGNPVDLNGSPRDVDPDGDGVALDSAECLYYFLCCKFKANPGASFVDNNFTDLSQYVKDPSLFEFQPGGYLPRTGGGPFYAPNVHEVGDTDGDGYLELLDGFGNPIYYDNLEDAWSFPTDHAASSYQFPHNKTRVDLYSQGPNGQDNLGHNDKVKGAKGSDDDGDGLVDNEDDIGNWE